VLIALIGCGRQTLDWPAVLGMLILAGCHHPRSQNRRPTNATANSVIPPFSAKARYCPAHGRICARFMLLRTSWTCVTSLSSPTLTTAKPHRG
jgi:hypothetical protein